MVHDNKLAYIKELRQEFCFPLRVLEPVAEFLLQEAATVQAVYLGDTHAETRVQFLGNCGKIVVQYARGGDLQVIGENDVIYIG